jgi:hypothetical protein
MDHSPSASIDRPDIVKKVTRRLIPFVGICYLIAYIDRQNVSFAPPTPEKIEAMVEALGGDPHDSSDADSSRIGSLFGIDLLARTPLANASAMPSFDPCALDKSGRRNMASSEQETVSIVFRAELTAVETRQY